MKKRIVSLLLSLALMFALLPTQTFALKAQVSKMTVEIAAPKAGAHPSYTATLGSEMYTLRSKNSDGYTNGILWRDVNEGKTLTASDAFAEGHTYRVYVQFAAPSSSEILSDATCKINGVAATRVQGQSTPEYYVEFPALPKAASQIAITVNEPEAGKAPTFNATVSEGAVLDQSIASATYFKNGVCWRDADKKDVPFAKAGGVFEAGKAYYVSFALSVQPGYAFPFDAVGNPTVAATVNGNNAEVLAISDGGILVHYTFPKTTTATKTITNLAITVNKPEAGKAPTFAAMVSEGAGLDQSNVGDYYYKNGVCWRDADKKDVPFAKAGGVFEAGKAYYVAFALSAKDGYAFARDDLGNPAVAATVNGKNAQVHGMLGGWVMVDYTFPKTQTDRIVSNIDLVVTAPVAGEMPNFTVETRGDEGYEVEDRNTNASIHGVCWSITTQMSTALAHTDKPFEEGIAYRVWVNLRAKNGYTFELDGDDRPVVNVTVNGQTAKTTPMSEEDAFTVYYVFPKTGEKDSKTISAADFTFTPPKPGDKYSNFDFISNTENTGSIFFDVRENGSEQQFKGTYAAGNSYLFRLYVEPAPGYTYAETVAVTVNGAPVEGVRIAETGDLYVPVMIDSLAEPDKIVSHVDLTFTPPKAGDAYNAFGYASKTEGTGEYWFRVEEEGSEEFFRGVYEAGKTYDYRITVDPASGFAIAEDATVTLNGEKATTGPSSSKGSINVYFSYTIPKDDGKTVTELDVTFVQPKPGDTYNTFDVKVKSGEMLCSAYRVEENGSGEMFEGTYTEGNSYLFYLTFVLQDGYKLPADPQKDVTVFLNGEKRKIIYADERYVQILYQIDSLKNANPFEDVASSDLSYDAVLWAYYAAPQVTNGIDASHFGPDMSVTRGQAVTFLWRAAGCPEPTETANPFVDVATDAYYYKPVLWAVEKGITNGTDATHFTPDQTCSTAHIITFLYRTMGLGSNGWYEVAEAWAIGAGLLENVGLSVDPGELCPRGMVVLFLYRVLGK